MHNTLHERYYKIETKETYVVQTWSQTKSSEVILPGVSWCKENIRYDNKLRSGQGRTGIGCKKSHLIESITSSGSKSCEIPKIPMLKM